MKALFLVLLLATLVAADGIVKPSTYPPRSGNVIIEPLKAQSRGAKMCFFDKSHRYFANSKSAAPLPATALASAVCRAFNVLPPTRDELHFVHTDVFSNPTANLLITVDDVDGAAGLSSLKAASCHEVDDGIYPNSVLPLAATMATGASPSQHGVVGAAWPRGKGEEAVLAYSDSESWAQHMSFGDLIMQSTEGKSNVVSVSSDPQLASAFGISPALPAVLQSNGYTASLQDNKWTCGANRIGCPFEAEMTLDRVAHAVKSNAAVFGAVGATVRGHLVTLADEVKFDLADPAHFKLLAEVVFATEVLPKVLASRHLASDVITVSFAGLRGLNAAQLKHGVRLVDAAIRSLVAAVNTIYGGAVIHEVVLLGRTPALPEKTVDAIVSALPQLKPDEVKRYLPSLFVPDEHIGFACAALPAWLEELQLTAVCPKVVQPQVLAAADSDRERPLNAVHLQGSGGGNAGHDFIPPAKGTRSAIYQITMWTAIMLAVILAMGIYALGCMNFRKDTLLYSSFNPNWEDRKRR